MSAQNNDQDLLPEQTEGFKVGEKKTMDQINQLGEQPISYRYGGCLEYLSIGVLGRATIFLKSS